MVKVNKNSCIGCGSCVAIADEVFDFDDDGYATIKSNIQEKENENLIKEAIDNCPTDAISYE